MSTLIGWWKGENNANDNGSNGLHGTWSGTARYATGFIGNAFNFPATAEVRIPYNSIFDVLNNPTSQIISDFYIKFPSEDFPVDISGVHIITLYAGVSWPDDISWTIKLNDQMNLEIFYNDSGVLRSRKVTEYDFVYGNWYHVIVTYNNGLWTVNIDGTNYLSINLPFTQATPTPIIQFGDRAGEEYYSFNDVLVDEVKLYGDNSNTKTVRFTDASKGGPLSYDLDFGDGSAHATSLPVDHEYNLGEVGDSVDVTLSVTGSKNQSDSITKTVPLT